MLPADGRRLCRGASGYSEKVSSGRCPQRRWRVPEPPAVSRWVDPIVSYRSRRVPDSLEGSGDHRGCLDTEGKQVRKFIISAISLVALAASRSSSRSAPSAVRATTNDARRHRLQGRGHGQFPGMEEFRVREPGPTGAHRLQRVHRDDHQPARVDSDGTSPDPLPQRRSSPAGRSTGRHRQRNANGKNHRLDSITGARRHHADDDHNTGGTRSFGRTTTPSAKLRRRQRQHLGVQRGLPSLADPHRTMTTTSLS